MLGANRSAYLQPGQFQLSLGYRTLNSFTHYNLDELQQGRRTNQTYVINKQRLADAGITYQLDDRLSLTFGAPGSVASWSIPLPFVPLGPRYQQDGRGLGDLSLVARYWTRDPKKNPGRNLSVGLGFKAPTGDYDQVDDFPNFAGKNIRKRFIDSSIQPGDGGWGLIFDLAGFRHFPETAIGRDVVAFTSLTYLANPRDTNGTPSIIQTLEIAPTPAILARQAQFNSVPDSYVFRSGLSRPLGTSGFSALLAFRREGLPRYDLIGGSHGFRRPGHEDFIEPGLAYSKGSDTFQFSVPLAVAQYRELDAYTNTRGDATFPREIFLFNWSHRFSTRKPTAPSGPPACDVCPPGKCIHVTPAGVAPNPPPVVSAPRSRG